MGGLSQGRKWPRLKVNMQSGLRALPSPSSIIYLSRGMSTSALPETGWTTDSLIDLSPGLDY